VRGLFLWLGVSKCLETPILIVSAFWRVKFLETPNQPPSRRHPRSFQILMWMLKLKCVKLYILWQSHRLINTWGFLPWWESIVATVSHTWLIESEERQKGGRRRCWAQVGKRFLSSPSLKPCRFLLWWCSKSHKTFAKGFLMSLRNSSGVMMTSIRGFIGRLGGNYVYWKVEVEWAFVILKVSTQRCSQSKSGSFCWNQIHYVQEFWDHGIIRMENYWMLNWGVVVHILGKVFWWVYNASKGDIFGELGWIPDKYLGR